MNKYTFYKKKGQFQSSLKTKNFENKIQYSNKKKHFLKI